jgi:hypothetical protein
VLDVATPSANVEHSWTARRELAESARRAPLLKADQCKASCWMQARTECLARVDRDDCITRSSDVFAPRGANNNATDTQDGELSAPAGCPLFGGDRSYEQRSNATQANATTREGGEAFELRYQRGCCGAVACAVGEPGANADWCCRVVDGSECVAIDRWWCCGFGAGARRGEASESLADCLGGFGVALNAEFEPAVGAQC